MIRAKSLSEILSPVQDSLDRVETLLENSAVSSYPLVRDLSEYMASLKGKRLRPALALLAGGAAGGITPDHLTLSVVTELIHTATLIHDDVIDEADMRRGQPSHRARFGNEVSVIFGDFLFSISFILTESFEAASVRRRLAETTGKMCEGELLQHQFLRSDRPLTVDDYLQMIRLKTACFMGACSALGADLAGADGSTIEGLDRYGEEFGIAFQIVDDCLDFSGEEDRVGKSLGTDALTGKITLPLLHLRGSGSDVQVREMEEILSAGPDLNGKLARLRELMEGAGSFDASRLAAADAIARAKEALSPLPDTQYKESLLELADFVLARDF